MRADSVEYSEHTDEQPWLDERNDPSLRSQRSIEHQRSLVQVGFLHTLVEVITFLCSSLVPRHYLATRPKNYSISQSTIL